MYEIIMIDVAVTKCVPNSENYSKFDVGNITARRNP